MWKAVGFVILFLAVASYAFPQEPRQQAEEVQSPLQADSLVDQLLVEPNQMAGEHYRAKRSVNCPCTPSYQGDAYCMSVCRSKRYNSGHCSTNKYKCVCFTNL